MLEGSRSGSGSVPLTDGSGSRRPKNMWIRNTVIPDPDRQHCIRVLTRGLSRTCGSWTRTLWTPTTARSGTPALWTRTTARSGTRRAARPHGPVRAELMTLQEGLPQTELKMLSTYIRGEQPVGTQHGAIIGSVAVLRIRCLFDPWIRNPGWKKFGSGINIPDPQH